MVMFFSWHPSLAPPSSRSWRSAANSVCPSADTWPTCCPAWPTAPYTPWPNSSLPPAPPKWQRNLIPDSTTPSSMGVARTATMQSTPEMPCRVEEPTNGADAGARFGRDSAHCHRRDPERGGSWSEIGSEIGNDGKAKIGRLRSFLPLPARIPSPDTLHRAFAALDPRELGKEPCGVCGVGEVDRPADGQRRGGHRWQGATRDAQGWQYWQ